MEQVYQDTICIQPIIIASRNSPLLVELSEFEEEQDGGAANQKEQAAGSGPNV